MKPKFIWDKSKNLLNVAKHGLNFEDVKLVLKSPIITFEDNRFDYGERRLVTLGMLERHTVVIVHTPRGNKIRIISMRKANAKEKKIYQERFKTLR